MRKQSKENQRLQAELREQLGAHVWADGQPLPPARELAKRFKVSSSTAYRILVRLTEEKLLWQHHNGRFYAAEARHLVDTVHPFACMLPQLHLWNAALQKIMQGVTQRSSHYKRGILLVHNADLVEQPDIGTEPHYADPAAQERMLQEFFTTHADSCEGIIFDNVWRDDVLVKFHDRLKRMVVINRHSELDFVSTVAPDFHRCALLAFAHLYARGFDRIVFVSSHDDYYIRQSTAAALQVAREIAADFSADDVHAVRSSEDRRRLAGQLKQRPQRTAVYCPDDNWARLFHQDLVAAGVSCPEKVGLLSGIGTNVVRGEHPLSTLSVDFELIGRQAVDCLRSDQPRAETVGVDLIQGPTT